MTGPRTTATAALAAAALLVAGIGAWTSRRPPAAEAPAETHAGSASCARCHPAQAAAWGRSHHALAQLGATAAVPEGFATGPVKGAPGRLTVAAPDATGAPATFPVAGLIGVAPLVQPLVAFDRGRLQASSWAFDTERREWLDLHGPEARRPHEWGHWTNRGMTWNVQCAYCHTTAFEKGYDAERDAFASRYVELGVGCESCHGPYGRHAATAVGPAPPPRPEGAFVPGDRPDPDIETCASCHARRGQIRDGGVYLKGRGERFLDLFDPTALDDPAYHADGQIREEDYEWGSFVQSRMYAKGVRCTHCHDAHSATLKAEGDLLCLRCHEPRLATRAHTLHEPPAAGPTTTGAAKGVLCVDCHMPRTVYMLRDPRRDHSFSLPDPELSERLGVPNACERCHRDRPPAWIRSTFEAHYGARRRPAADRAVIVQGGRAGYAEAVPGLLNLLADRSLPALWRASAATLLARWAARGPAGPALAAALDDPHPLVRARAARALEGVLASPAGPLVALLRDPVRLVRTSAAGALWPFEPQLAGDDRAALVRARDELLAGARFNADAPAGRQALARYAEGRGDVARAEKEYRAALHLDPHALPLRARLAVVLLEARRPAEAVALLEEAVALDPDNPSAHLSLGLTYAQAGRLADGERALERSVALAPRDPAARYSLALAYVQTGRRAQAAVHLREVLRLVPGHREARRMLDRLH